MLITIDNIFTVCESNVDEHLYYIEQALTFKQKEGEYKAFESNDTSVKFLTGHLTDVLDVIKSKSIDFSIIDNTPKTESIPVDPDVLVDVTLHPYQVNAAQTVIDFKRLKINIPAGGGKTEISLASIATLWLPTLFVVNKTSLLTQTYKRFISRGFSPSEVSMIGGGVGFNKSALFVIATYQSLNSKIKSSNKDVINFLNSVRVLVIDEGHHGSAPSYIGINNMTVNADYRISLSASPKKHLSITSYEDVVITGYTGKELVSIPVEWLVAQGYLTKTVVYCVDVPDKPVHENGRLSLSYDNFDWRSVYNYGIINNYNYNNIVVDIAYSFYKKGYKVLIGVRELPHGKSIVELLYKKYQLDTEFSSGGNSILSSTNGVLHKGLKSVDNLKEEYEQLDRFILIGSKIYEEALDLPYLNVIINCIQGRSVASAIQFPGRGSRISKDKSLCYYIDFNCKYSLVLTNQFKVRLQVYETLYSDIHLLSSPKQLIDDSN